MHDAADTIIRRWELFTGKRAALDGCKRTFEGVAEERLGFDLGEEAA